MNLTIRPIASTDELANAAALGARLQHDPANHIGYLDVEVGALQKQFAQLEPLGADGVIGAFDEGALIGVLGADWDTDPPRVWWHGPLVDVTDDGDPDEADHRWARIAGSLYTAAQQLVPATVTEEEILPDERNERLARFAHHYRFELGSGAAVLSRELDTTMPAPDLPGIEVRAFRDADRAAVAAIHDRLFPGSHLPGGRVDEGRERQVFVAVRDLEPVGYVAIDRQHDGQGYLDFVGVTDAERGLGIGTALAAQACAWARDAGSSGVHLTVRTSNVAARRLYERLGFTEERILVPWRRTRGG